MVRSPEGRLATLERGGDAGRGRGPRRGALERGGDRPAGSRGLGWAALCTWAAYWASLSHFLSFVLKGDCRPSWARLPSMCLCFYGDFSPLIRMPLIMLPYKWSSPLSALGLEKSRSLYVSLLSFIYSLLLELRKEEFSTTIGVNIAPCIVRAVPTQTLP